MKSKNQQRRLKKKLKREQEPEKVIELSDELKKSSIAMLARKFEWISPEDPLFEMYTNINQRFKHKLPEQIEEPVEEHSQPLPSRKQQRLQEKPQLSDLKKSTNKPELVEWFDADAKFPEFHILLKTLPGVVQVPANWRMRNEIPQFGHKPSYELPPNIRATGIAEPRVGSAPVDVDYELMHAAFFSQESKALAEPTELLPFGQVADLHFRQRSAKPKLTQVVKKPKHVSERLRRALGLKPGEKVPWDQTVQDLGPAPGYSSETLQLWGSF